MFVYIVETTYVKCGVINYIYIAYIYEKEYIVLGYVQIVRMNAYSEFSNTSNSRSQLILVN